jgi:acetyl esterase/lipase
MGLIRLRPVIAALIFVSASQILASENSGWALDLANQYRVVPDVTYLTADGHESKLDVIGPRDTGTPLPTLIYIHGGGWVGGDKDMALFRLLPYLEMGFAVVNVEYRLARVALAPAAVEDGRCALRWVINNADTYGFDPDRIVVSGHSAGGHLTLTTGMLPASAGLDRRCPARNPSGERADAHEAEMPVAAMINWYGITDVADLVEGPNAKTYAVAWMGGRADWRSVADRVSPLNHVRSDLPPVLTIHGNADPIVPYEHAVRLHEALDKAEVPARLHTIDGGGHGRFTAEESRVAMSVIRDFLEEHRLID